MHVRRVWSVDMYASLTQCVPSFIKICVMLGKRKGMSTKNCFFFLPAVISNGSLKQNHNFIRCTNL